MANKPQKTRAILGVAVTAESAFVVDADRKGLEPNVIARPAWMLEGRALAAATSAAGASAQSVVWTKAEAEIQRMITEKGCGASRRHGAAVN